MTELEAQAGESDTVSQPQQAGKGSLRRRLTSIASIIILAIILLAPIIAFFWLRGTLIREREDNALWHTQTMLIRYLARTRGEWPDSWDDLEADFQPTNHSQRTDSIESLKCRVHINFEVDLDLVDLDETEDCQAFISLKSGRLPGETTRANRKLREFIRKSRSRADRPR